MEKLESSKSENKFGKREFGLLIVSILIYLVVNSLFGVFQALAGTDIPYYYGALISIIPAVYFYKARKRKWQGQD